MLVCTKLRIVSVAWLTIIVNEDIVEQNLVLLQK